MLDNELNLVSMQRIDMRRFYLEIEENIFIDSIPEFYFFNN